MHAQVPFERAACKQSSACRLKVVERLEAQRLVAPACPAGGQVPGKQLYTNPKHTSFLQCCLQAHALANFFVVLLETTCSIIRQLKRCSVSVLCIVCAASEGEAQAPDHLQAARLRRQQWRQRGAELRLARVHLRACHQHQLVRDRLRVWRRRAPCRRVRRPCRWHRSSLGLLASGAAARRLPCQEKHLVRAAVRHFLRIPIYIMAQLGMLSCT